MSWTPLVKTEIDFKGMSKSEVIKQNKKMLIALFKENGIKHTGKKIRQIANQSYVDLMKDEVWVNDLYQVNVDRYSSKHFIHLSIKNNNKSQICVSKWTHFQWIKNQLCGEESEGLELYPSEKRLINTANQYHIWVLKDKVQIPCGWNDGRVITDRSEFGTKQTLETKGRNK